MHPNSSLAMIGDLIYYSKYQSFYCLSEQNLLKLKKLKKTHCLLAKLIICYLWNLLMLTGVDKDVFLNYLAIECCSYTIYRLEYDETKICFNEKSAEINITVSDNDFNAYMGFYEQLYLYSGLGPYSDIAVNSSKCKHIDQYIEEFKVNASVLSRLSEASMKRFKVSNYRHGDIHEEALNIDLEQYRERLITE
jgi:hypothetical protein